MCNRATSVLFLTSGQHSRLRRLSNTSSSDSASMMSIRLCLGPLGYPPATPLTTAFKASRASSEVIRVLRMRLTTLSMEGKGS